MMSNADFSVFSQFVAQDKNKRAVHQGVPKAVAYSRVSSKEQFESNGSLESQEKMITRFATQANIPIAAKFGGVYESAVSDERKEFIRMMEFIKKSKENIKFILVSDNDRFSRTGANAIFLAEKLRQKGVQIIACSAPLDTTTPIGAFQQNMQLLFSHFDNQLRRDRTIRGMKQKFEKGYITGKAPMGYDQKNVNGEMIITVNQTGRAIAKAFKWKAEQGLKSSEIALRLHKLGYKIREKQLSRIFRNLFYCGLLSNRMLGATIVQGRWPALVSKENFLKANEILTLGRPSKYDYKRENENIPLKHFVFCNKCKTKWTGYIVKKKRLYYYKCNTKGCRCNKSAKEMHKQFSTLLQQYQIPAKHNRLLRQQLIYTFESMHKEVYEERKELETQEKSLQNQIESVEEKFIGNLIDHTTYDKHLAKFRSLLAKIQGDLAKQPPRLSNPEKFVDESLQLCRNLSQAWNSATLDDQQKIQTAIFPDGIAYDRKNSTYRTPRVNTVILTIISQSRLLEEKKTGNPLSKKKNSPLVPRRGIEVLNILKHS